MAREIPFTLHRCVNFKWVHIEVTIHGQLIHLIYFINSIPVTKEFDGATFHTMEIMQDAKIDK